MIVLFLASWLGFLSKQLQRPRAGHMTPAVLTTGRSQPGVPEPSHAVPDISVSTLALSFRVVFRTQEGGPPPPPISMFGLQLCLYDFAIFPSSQLGCAIGPVSSAAIGNLHLN